MPPAPASVANDNVEDLGSIEGIEPWIADVLHKCGVGQFTALADFSPEALATTLRERALVELTAARIEREDWLGQARGLGKANRSTEPGSDEPDARFAG
jgi:predicted flap endonuclease-1-like 5' DNA nuclease